MEYFTLNDGNKISALGLGTYTLSSKDVDELKSAFITNVIGTWSATQKFLPLLIKSE
mgnify:CR=1 FL=1